MIMENTTRRLALQRGEVGSLEFSSAGVQCARVRGQRILGLADLISPDQRPSKQVYVSTLPLHLQGLQVLVDIRSTWRINLKIQIPGPPHQRLSSPLSRGGNRDPEKLDNLPRTIQQSQN